MKILYLLLQFDWWVLLFWKCKRENFNGDKCDNDYVILKQNFEERNAPILPDSGFGYCECLSESSELNKGYVKNFLFDKTITINSLSKLYFDLKVQTSCPVRF